MKFLAKTINYVTNKTEIKNLGIKPCVESQNPTEMCFQPKSVDGLYLKGDMSSSITTSIFFEFYKCTEETKDDPNITCNPN